MSKSKHWIQDVREGMERRGTEGGLHRMLHVPADKKIPLSRIDAELKKRGITTLKRQRLQFAKNVRHKAEAGLDDFLDWAQGYGLTVSGTSALPLLRLPTTGDVVPGEGLRRVFARCHFTIGGIRRIEAGAWIEISGLKHNGKLPVADEFQALGRALSAAAASLRLDGAALAAAVLRYSRSISASGATAAAEPQSYEDAINGRWQKFCAFIMHTFPGRFRTQRDRGELELSCVDPMDVVDINFDAEREIIMNGLGAHGLIMSATLHIDDPMVFTSGVSFIRLCDEFKVLYKSVTDAAVEPNTRINELIALVNDNGGNVKSNVKDFRRRVNKAFKSVGFLRSEDVLP